MVGNPCEDSYIIIPWRKVSGEKHDSNKTENVGRIGINTDHRVKLFNFPLNGVRKISKIRTIRVVRFSFSMAARARVGFNQHYLPRPLV